MHSTSPVVPLTSYTETLPSANAAARRVNRAMRASSILLSPLSAKAHRHGKKTVTPEGTARMSHSAASLSAAADVSGGFPRVGGWSTAAGLREDVSQGLSDAGSMPSTDMPLAATAGAGATSRLSLGRTGSGVSGASPGGSLPRGDSLDPADVMHFTTFTSHLRYRLAMSDAGIDNELSLSNHNNNNNNNNNNSSNAVVPPEKEGKVLSATSIQALPRINSPRLPFAATTTPPVKPHSPPGTPLKAGTPTFQPPLSLSGGSSSHTSKATVKFVDFVPSAADPTIGKMDCIPESTSPEDRHLDVLSRELTSLLQKSDALMEQLARSHRPLQPEQLRCLAHMQVLSASAVSVPDLRRDVLGASTAPSVRTAAAAAAASSAPASDDATRFPTSRMMVRAPRNVTFEQN